MTTLPDRLYHVTLTQSRTVFEKVTADVVAVDKAAAEQEVRHGETSQDIARGWRMVNVKLSDVAVKIKGGALLSEVHQSNLPDKKIVDLGMLTRTEAEAVEQFLKELRG